MPIEPSPAETKLVKNSQTKAAPQRRRPKAGNSGKRRLLLQITAAPGTEVFVAGDFNNWDETKTRLSDQGHPGSYRRYIYVEPGRYEYKFKVGGEWQIDPNCDSWTPNEFGSLNSVIEASKPAEF